MPVEHFSRLASASCESPSRSRYSRISFPTMLLRSVAENNADCNTPGSAGLRPLAYALGMKGWEQRFRAHMRLHKLSQERLGSDLDVSQGAIGHWLRGFREINLAEFWRLCEAAGANPKLILFGVENEPLTESIRQTLAAHPELIPSYPRFEKSLHRKKKTRKPRRKVPA